MTGAFTPLELLENWCREAVAAHGDDWTAINTYIRRQLDAMNEVERTRFEVQIPTMFELVCNERHRH